MFILNPSPGKESKTSKKLEMVLPLLENRDNSLIPFADYTKMLLAKLLLSFKSDSYNSYLGFHGHTFLGYHRNYRYQI